MVLYWRFRREELDMSWIPNLITTSTDKLLRFYHVKVTSNAASDNDCSRVKSLFFKRLPSKGAAKRGKKDSDSYHDKLFFFGKWIAKEKILTGGANGDLISWTIDLNWERSMINSEGTSSVEKKVFVDFKVVDSGGHDSGHNKAIQSITCYNNSLVFTHAMDRYLCVWKLPEMKNVATLSTLGGSVFDLDISPVSKTWLAVASGGGFLHIWNSSLALQDSVELSAKLNDTRFKMMHVWQGYKTKVSRICQQILITAPICKVYQYSNKTVHSSNGLLMNLRLSKRSTLRRVQKRFCIKTWYL